MNALRRAYEQQLENARGRSIDFLFTFKEWLEVWKSSGKLNERGVGGDRYCMARFNDAGAYMVGNVKIITNRENQREQRMSEKNKEFHRNRMLGNQHLLGYKHSEETKRRIGAAGMGNTNAVGGKARLGQPHSEESKAKMRTAKLGNQYARKHWPEETVQTAGFEL